MANTWRTKRTRGRQGLQARRIQGRTQGGPMRRTELGHEADTWRACGGHMADKLRDAARAYRGQPFFPKNYTSIDRRPQTIFKREIICAPCPFHRKNKCHGLNQKHTRHASPETQRKADYAWPSATQRHRMAELCIKIWTQADANKTKLCKHRKENERQGANARRNFKADKSTAG